MQSKMKIDKIVHIMNIYVNNNIWEDLWESIGKLAFSISTIGIIIYLHPSLILGSSSTDSHRFSFDSSIIIGVESISPDSYKKRTG